MFKKHRPHHQNTYQHSPHGPKSPLPPFGKSPNTKNRAISKRSNSKSPPTGSIPPFAVSSPSSPTLTASAKPKVKNQKEIVEEEKNARLNKESDYVKLIVKTIQVSMNDDINIIES